MLSRGNSDAATRLRRAKSTSSVKTYRPAASDSNAIDPEVAHQHAVVAASRAYEEAHGRVSPQKKASDAKDVADEAGQRLGRRQSVRFTGPSAVNTKQRSITRRQAPESAAARPKLHGAVSFDRGPDILTQDSNGVITASHTTEYVERRVSSTPSSYKKIRKTKSMFNPAKTPSLSFMTGSSKKRSQRLSQLVEAGSDNTRPESPADISLSSPAQADATSKNQDTYVRQLEQQRLKEKSFFMEFAKPRKSAKVFRRTVRTSSTNSYGSAVGSAAAQSKEPSHISGIGNRARSVSVVLKNRLKKVFQRQSDPEECVPKQQLSASRPYFGGYMFASNGVQQHYEHHIPPPDGETLRRVDSRGSTVRDASAFVEKPSNPASIRSVRSDVNLAEETSRVSSWADSTATGSLATNQAKENKRLSIIHEHGGPYQPSSSMRSYGDLSHRYAAFNDPIRDYSAGGLFSSLKKKIEENKRAARFGNGDNQEIAKHQIADLTPRGSSYKARNLSTGTISEEFIGNHNPFNGPRPANLAVLNPPAKSPESNLRENRLDIGNGNQSSPQFSASEEGDITPRRPLQEVSSAFFPPSTRIERRSTSPFRRAKATSSDEGTIVQLNRTPQLSTISAAGDSRTGFLHVRSFSRSDSIYSRTTSGNTPAPSPSPPSLSDSEDTRGVGTAVVARKAMKYEKPLSPRQESGASSAKSSGDWQRWLSKEVAQLEARTLKASEDQEISPASTIGHKREGAQFEDQDVEVGKLQISATPKQLFSALRECSTPKPVLKSQSIEDLPKRFPLAEIRSSTVTPHKEQPFSKVSHASLTNTSSNANLNKRYGISLKPSPTGSSDTLRTASSLGQLRDRSSGIASPHYSPDREARLRRMQSSNSIETRRQNENKPFYRTENTPPAGSGLENARPSLMTSPSADNYSPGSQLMIERFLGERRRHMRISEDNSTDPAFL
ncbi:MAG: hypothetical protein Q9195_007918 [Heterodermia aff. obscurata]